jgi:hypothetical protein
MYINGDGVNQKIIYLYKIILYDSEGKYYAMYFSFSAVYTVHETFMYQMDC